MVNRFLERNLPDSAKAHQLQSQGLTRYFLVHEPENLKSNAPVVILLHGGGGSMRKNFIYPTTSQWLTLADQHEFLLISPNGVNPRTGKTDGNWQTWNGLRPGKDGRRSQADDVSFIANIIDWAAENHSIDRDRVYVTGASNGGELVFRLLIERPTLFAAGVANISSLPAIEIPRPEQGTPIMMMNGTEDPLMPWQGGLVRGVAEPVRPVPETIEYWIEVNNADKKAAVTTQLPDQAPNDGCRITATAYPKKPNGKPVVLFYVMEGGGHSTPFPREVPMPRRMRELLGNLCEDVDGTALAWDFMEEY
jgi:polyhydroxybutyrate depolymerase